MREALWEWSNADDYEEKYSAAEKVNFYGAFRKVLKDKGKIHYKLSDEEEANIEEAKEFFTELMDRFLFFDAQDRAAYNVSRREFYFRA